MRTVKAKLVTAADLRKQASDRFSQRTKEYLKKYKGELTDRDESDEYTFPDERSAKNFVRDMKTTNAKQYKFLLSKGLIDDGGEDHGAGYHSINQSRNVVWVSWNMP